jgi:hypothetical protein
MSTKKASESAARTANRMAVVAMRQPAGIARLVDGCMLAGCEYSATWLPKKD